MISDFRGEYRWLSNFHLCPVWFGGVLYPSTEHAYQAAKTLDPLARHRILTRPTPGDARREGQTLILRPEWDTVKLVVMETILREKFKNPELRAKLLGTFPHNLVEGNWWGDIYWGVCDGVGANHLGRLLMKIRAGMQAELRGIDT